MEQPEVERLRELEKENVRLKRLLAERDVEVEVMKDLWKTKRAWPAVAGWLSGFMESRGDFCGGGG
ncbi:MAG TPA: hypothetical protein VHQ47_12765 [Phycisphaerae bacterium]|nr:hypothetical protein [Phycisphaerae bacterium]